MGMNIACGNTKNDARNSLSGEVDGSGIGTSGSADGELVGDAGVEGGLFYKAGEARVGNGGRIVKADLDASSEFPLGFRRSKTRSVVGGRAFQNDGAVREDCLGSCLAPRIPTSSWTVAVARRMFG